MNSVSFDPHDGGTYEQAAKLTAHLIFHYDSEFRVSKFQDAVFIDFRIPPKEEIVEFCKAFCPTGKIQ